MATPADPVASGAARAYGRSLEDFGELSAAEQTLRDCCRLGDVATIATTRPESQTEENTVRASFVRFLALGGDEKAPVHEHGVRLQGAWLTGVLDLEAAKVVPLGLWSCRMELIEAHESNLKSLTLSGSSLLSGLAGHGLYCEGSVLLHNQFCAMGEIRLSGSTIAGDLILSGGQFENDQGHALLFPGAEISGSVNFDAGFRATGKVNLVGTTIGGTLYFGDARFENDSGEALSCDGARVTGPMFFRNVEWVSGDITLAGMQAGALCDDATSWTSARGELVLDAFTYGRLSGGAPTDAATRIAWLDRQWADHLGTEFKPQPWEQMIAVLRSMGHPEEARTVAIAKQNRLRRAGKIPFGARFLHWLYGLLVGYGYRPLRLLFATGLVWLTCSLAYWVATNPSWLGAETFLLVPASPEPGMAAPPAAYRNFVPLVYSADVLLPVVDLGYKDEWQPVVADRAGRPLIWGQLLRFLYWFEIAFGWVAGLLLVGVLGNLIKKD